MDEAITADYPQWVKDLRRRQEEMEATLNEHEDRLDAHDLKFLSIEATMRELRALIHRMQGDILRCADAATANTLTLSSQAKAIYLQHASIEQISMNVSSILILLQPKAIL